MKRFIYIIAIFSLASCSFLDENPQGKLTTEGFFTNASDLDASLNSLYSVVATSQQQNNHVGTNFLHGDDISTHPASNKQSLREFDQYDVADNNAWMQSLWEQRFKVIKAANFIINNASRTPDVAQEDIDAAIAQAHYWRAFEYFYLVTTWGPVPVMLSEMIDYNAPLVSEEKIYELIISDLKTAEAGCPVTYSKAPYFQNGVNVAVSQAAVKATMAYVYMCMAGWPLNKTEYYEKAADKAWEVIEGARNGDYYYDLLPSFSDIHSMAHNRNNKELLLGIYYNRDRHSNASAATDILLEMGGWGDTQGEIKFWYDFPPGPRKDATYFPKLMLKNSIPEKDSNENDEQEGDDKEEQQEPEWVERDWWYSPKDDKGDDTREVVAPIFMKSAEGLKQGEEFDYKIPAGCIEYGEKTIQIIRLSQVYCWYAEAVGRSGKVTAEAVEALNRVRNRADGAVTDMYSTAMSPEELAEAAYNEHGWEVAGYYWSGFATRARDMFRMYRYKEHFEYRVENPLIEVAPGIFRKEAVPVSGSWKDSKMYAPYPYTDSAVNPSM